MTLGTSSESGITASSIIHIRTLYPGLRPLIYRTLESVYLSTKRRMNVVQSARSWDEQAALYAKGRLFQDGRWTIQDAGQVVTNAKPGSSFHNFGLALDCAWAGRDPYLAALTKGERNALWEDFGRIGKSYGFTWGGDFKLLNGVRDLPHLELSYGLSLSQCQELYEIGQLPAVWAFLDKQRGEPEGEGWITSRS